MSTRPDSAAVTCGTEYWPRDSRSDSLPACMPLARAGQVLAVTDNLIAEAAADRARLRIGHGRPGMGRHAREFQRVQSGPGPLQARAGRQR